MKSCSEQVDEYLDQLWSSSNSHEFHQREMDSIRADDMIRAAHERECIAADQMCLLTFDNDRPCLDEYEKYWTRLSNYDIH